MQKKKKKNFIMDSLPSKSKTETIKNIKKIIIIIIQRIQSPKFIPMTDISTQSFRISLVFSDLDLQEVNGFFK